MQAFNFFEADMDTAKGNTAGRRAEGRPAYIVEEGDGGLWFRTNVSVEVSRRAARAILKNFPRAARPGEITASALIQDLRDRVRGSSRNW